ncbi:Cuticle protein 7, partial [Caligus rogercresseyi]
TLPIKDKELLYSYQFITNCPPLSSYQKCSASFFLCHCPSASAALGDHPALTQLPTTRPCLLITAPAPYHPGPAYKPAPYVDESPKPYAFQYGVADDYSGARFSAEGTLTQDHLWILPGRPPDGRIQTVTYTADDYAGFIADVKYEGTPVYPKYEPKPAPYKPAPYKPAPYKPAPYKPAP